jgi:hypothetical protein
MQAESEARAIKVRLLARMEESRRALLAALDRAGPDVLQRSGSWGEWTLKDLIAHLVYWQTSAAERLQLYIAGDTGAALALAPTDDAATDEINAGVYRANRDRPLAEMLETFAVSYGTLRTAAKSVPAALYTKEELPLRAWLAGNSFEHYDEHLPDVERALSAGQS